MSEEFADVGIQVGGGIDAEVQAVLDANQSSHSFFLIPEGLDFINTILIIAFLAAVVV